MTAVRTGVLEQIEEEMAALSKTERDVEGWHARADELLIETIHWLVAGEPRVIEARVLNIISDWEQLEKWYA